MARTLIEQSEFAAGVPVPEDGDVGDAASVDGAFQALTDRTRYLLNLVPNGLMLGGERLVVPPAGDRLVLSRIHALVLGGQTFSTVGPTELHPGIAEAPGMTGAAADVGWWYLYAFAQANALAFQLSRSAPDTALVFKTGTVTHRYLGTVLSRAVANMAGTSAVRGRYRMVNPIVAVNAAQAVQPRVESLAHDALLPGHVGRVSIEVDVQNTNAFAPIQLFVRDQASTFVNANRTVLTVPANETAQGAFEVTLSDAQAFVWFTTNDGGPGHPTTMRIVGFEEG